MIITNGVLPFSEEFADTHDNRECLAEKVILGELLTDIEKEFIRYLLLEKSPRHKKSGPPLNRTRDILLYKEHVKLGEEGVKGAMRMKKLGKELELPGLENVSRRAYFKALQNGRNHINNFNNTVKNINQIRKIRIKRKMEGFLCK